MSSRGMPRSGHHLLHRAQDRVVTAARAPAHVLVGLEILLRVLRRRLRLRRSRVGAHRLSSSSWLMASWISWLASGRPRTRLKPTASTRYSARRTRTSCPLLISGTSTRRYCAQDLAEVGRQRVQVPQVDRGDRLALGLRLLHRRGDGAVGAAPADHQHVAGGGAVDRGRRDLLRHAPDLLRARAAPCGRGSPGRRRCCR